ncbi:MAG: ABC transporter ATP-binding protein [Chloroflexi bacterium]|nr:ABC transporter ATP-binding protein [Chloroflexota bacterium]MCI0846102.1 ABC transporter ATP-binding protein [Chloroflexota bacterium]
MSILWRITQIAWQHRTRLLLAYLTFFIAIFFSLAIPWILGDAVDKLVVTSEMVEVVDGEEQVTQVIEPVADFGEVRTVLLWLAGALLVFSIFRGLFDFARTYLTDSLSQMVAYNLRNQMYDKLQHLSFAFHDKEHTGNIFSKVTSDLEAIRRFVMMGMVRSVEVVVRVAAISAILFFLDWQLTLISLVFVPFLVVRSSMVMVRMRDMWLHVQIIMGELTTILQENLSGIHVVKAFAAEEHEKRKYNAKAQELREDYFKNERLMGTNSAWVTLYFTLAVATIMWFGGWQIIKGNMSPGDLTKFVLFMGQLAFPIRMSAFVIATFSRAISSGGRLFEVLDARSPVEERPDARDMGRALGHVRFENVSFSYDSDTSALKNVDIDVPAGSMVALLGAPGSGKSTIVNLLPRFYSVTSGRITIDGTDIEEYTLSSLRHNVGIVQQEVFLFSGTVRNNIGYGVVDATDEEIIEAAKVAQLDEQILGLSDGYDTWVGERGVTLSGGQKQRLSIARTLLVNPPVLILDDSTSSVDVETERQIHRAMTEVMKGRTTFVIAHRLSTVREADLILVLKDGEIVERGNHRELINRGGIYQDIYELQLRPQEDVLLDATISGDDGGNS